MPEPDQKRQPGTPFGGIGANHLKRRVIRLSLWLLLLCPLATGMAQQAVSDQSVLKRLQVELQALEPLIREAQQAPVHPGSRLRFDYAALKQDLQTVRRGIAQYLEAPALPRAQPIQPLSGQYVR